MARIFSTLLFVTMIIATMPAPASAASASQGGYSRHKVTGPAKQNSVRLVRRAERLHRWCMRSVGPYRNNVTFRAFPT